MASKKTVVETEGRPPKRPRIEPSDDCLEPLRDVITREPASASVIQKALSDLMFIKVPKDVKKTTRDEHSDISKQKHYPMTHSPRGRALVVTMTGDRQGWQADINALHEMFLYLDIKANYVFDLMGEVLLKELGDFASSEQNQHADCLFVVFMGHGGTMDKGDHKNKEFLYTADKQAFYVQDGIKRKFNRPDLVGKPKVFIMQTCRAGSSAAREAAHHPRPTKAETDSSVETQKAPVSNFTDYLLCFATQSGYMAHRQTDKGSWYIQEVCKVFKEEAAHSHVADMLTKVNLKEKAGSDYGSVQVPEFVTSLTAPLYLISRLQPTGTDEQLSGTFESERQKGNGSGKDRADNKHSEDDVSLDFNNGKLEIKKNMTRNVDLPALKESRWRDFCRSINPTQVEVVNLGEVNLNRCTHDVFAFIYRCQNLSELLIDGITDSTRYDEDIADGLGKVSALLQKLVVLDIGNMYRWTSMLSSITSPSLRVLQVRKTVFAGARSTFIVCLENLPKLAWINLDETKFAVQEVLHKLLTDCPNLKGLRIINQSLRKHEKEVLPLLHKFKHIKLLDLYKAELNAELTKLVLESKDSVELINLYGNDISATPDEITEMLDSHRELRWLRMGESQIGRVAEKRLAERLRKRGGGLVLNGHEDPLWSKYNSHYEYIKQVCLAS